MDSWFLYFFERSVLQRKGRFIIASGSVMLTVSVVTALLMLSAGIRDNMGADLKQYGANMIVTGRSGKQIPAAVADTIRDLHDYVKDSCFQVYGSAVIGKHSFEITGAEPGKMKGYRVYGRLPQSPDELMVGVNLKDVLRAKEGDSLSFGNSAKKYLVTALFEKDPDEDSTIVMTIAGARNLAGTQDVSAVLLNADTGHLQEVEAAIRARDPSLEVKTLRQVAVAEERFLGRIQLLMLMVTGVVLFSSMITLSSTMGANVIERMEEIALLKAIGATGKDIRKFFMSEAGFSGLTGAFAGYCAGAVGAEVISRTAFGSFIPLNVYVAPLSIILGVCIAVAATYLPVRDAMKTPPAEILRGE